MIREFLTSFGVKVLVQEEEEPKRGQPGYVANQNVGGPRLREEKGRLLDPQEHGCHCQVEHSAEFQLATKFICVKKTNLPGSPSQSPAPSGPS